MASPNRYPTIPIPKDAAGDVEVGQGAAAKIYGWTNKAIQVSGSGWAFTFTLQKRLLGGNWVAITAATNLTAANIGDILAIADDADEIRMDVTVVTTQDDSFAVPLTGLDYGR